MNLKDDELIKLGGLIVGIENSLSDTEKRDFIKVLVKLNKTKSYKSIKAFRDSVNAERENTREAYRELED